MSTVIDTSEEKIEWGKGFYDQMFPILLKINTKSWTNDEYFNFCREHKDLQFETNAHGDLIIMPPTGAETGDKNSEINMQLRVWAKQKRMKPAKLLIQALSLNCRAVRKNLPTQLGF